MTSVTEVRQKITQVREIMNALRIDRVIFRRVDGFAWITAGRSNQVLFSSDTGVAEVQITAKKATVVTNSIEKRRFIEETLTGLPFVIEAPVWYAPRKSIKRPAERCVADFPQQSVERPMPAEITALRYRLNTNEITRYKTLGSDVAQAMYATLRNARPSWTELELAAELSKRLWEKQIEPALILAAGQKRLARYRHPLPTNAKLGSRAFLVTCARRHGLFANATRIRAFTKLSSLEKNKQRDILAIESEIFEGLRNQIPYSELWHKIREAYHKRGHAKQLSAHHQGGLTGYLSREWILNPSTSGQPLYDQAFAWNPSVTGHKIEDTILLTKQGLKILTCDSKWPTTKLGDLERPIIWE